MLMRLFGLLDNFPMLMLFVITVALTFLSYEGGFRAGRWRSRQPDHELEVVVRSMVAAMLGLLTFILAFTFWLAATHFDAVRQALLNEANAVRTTYLRADLLPEPQRTETRNLLREYIDVRLAAGRTISLDQAISRSEELHSQLWSQADAAKDKTSSPIFAGYFIQSLNEVIGLHARRLMVGMEFRIPSTIWVVLYVIMTLAAASIGCHGGLTGRRRPLVAVAFVLIISVVMVLIEDLDRPSRGAIKVSQRTMVDLRRTMSAPNR
ncbi:MAG: hypothetical protein ACREBD_01635 [Blastocatellia bacterium]